MSKKTMLTTQEAAERLSVAYQTIMAWIYAGKFPNAQKEETPRGIYYLIPLADVNSFEKPKRGRPAKEQAKKRERKAA